MKKIAIVTQSYKDDYKECRLLCESIDLFAPDMEHFIFVNDEDEDLFQTMNYGKHKVYKKGSILPWYLIRCPWKLLGHHFHISLFTIPVREWIVQQICKLGVFEIIGNEYDAVFNIDSETVLMKPLDITKWINSEGEYMLYKDIKDDEPSKDDYYAAVQKLLNISQIELSEIYKWNYMNTPVCFERSNLNKLLTRISKNVSFGGWKLALCNTYRFSEYYTYGVFTDYCLQKHNHFLIDYHYFPQIEMSSCQNANDFKERIMMLSNNPNFMGLWLQKANRKQNSKNYLSFDIIETVIKECWRQYE